MTDVENPIIQAFEFRRLWAEEHVTIFATDLRHAERIYFEWMGTHHPDEARRKWLSLSRSMATRPDRAWCSMQAWRLRRGLLGQVVLTMAHCTAL